MGSSVKQKNIIFGLCLIVGTLGAAYETYQLYRIGQVNQAITAGNLVTDDGYPYQQKFAAAYAQGTHFDYKHAVQSYGQLLETNPDAAERAKIQFNIGNNLFLSGLIRRVNDDGSLKDEAKYAFSQAKVAYEQSLRLAPDSRKAKFNLSLLHAILPQNMKGAPKDQSGVALSNLPIGLP